MAGRTLKTPALGRPMQLGMLYDCRDDTLIPGITLWDYTVLQNDRDVRTQRGAQFDIITSDSIDDKSTALNIAASLKANIFSGLVEVNGSAKYLNDKKTSVRQSRLTLHYRATTSFEQLTMKHLGRHNVQHPNVFDQGIGTHVVTGILYGAQAFFVFDRYINHEENKEDVQGHLDVIVKKISMLNIESKGDLMLNDTEKKEVEKIQCKFHGDFAIERNPANYREAVDIYTKLPSMLGQNCELAVPVTVWLYPLSHLDSKAATLVREISVNLISQTQNILEGLDKFQIKCDDLKNAPICRNFLKFREKLDLWKKLIAEFKLIFQQKLARVLPKIRGGEDGEESLSSLILENEQSPYNLHQLGVWIKSQEKEINIVKAYMNDLGRFRVVRSSEELEEMVIDPNKDHLVCFSFPFSGHEDEYLKHMTRYNKTQKPESFTMQKGWFDDVSVRKKIQLNARRFREFASANDTSPVTLCAVMGFDDGDIQAVEGGSLLLYQHGVLTTTEFTPPGTPGKPDIIEICHDAVTLKWSKSDSEFDDKQNYLIKYKENTESSTGWLELKTDDERNKATVANLKPNTAYVFTVASVCGIGVSQESVTSDVTKTRAVGPPSDVKKYQISKSSITVVWNEPVHVAEGVSVVKYRIKYQLITDSDTKSHMNIKETEETTCMYTINNLEPKKTYRVWVSADCGKDGNSIFCDPVDITTERKSKHTVALDLIQHAEKVKDGEPAIYKVPLSSEKRGLGTKYHNYHFGKQRMPTYKHTVIMVVGATGAGKSTLINGMINYILKVDWTDNFRFKIISEQNEDQAGGQSVSQTQYITSYTIHRQRGLYIPYTLTIIDTPGFGDTSGIERDKINIDQIREFFSHSDLHHIDHIDAIGFVAQASQARLTHTQKYVFDSILAIFGKDIAQNIMLLVTFADGQNPPVMDAIKEANLPGGSNFFKFNNSALFAKNNTSPGKISSSESPDNSDDEREMDDYFDKMFWQMGVQSMKKFFFALEKMEPRSLTLTKEVLKERKCLEVAVEGLQPQIQVGCCKLEELRKEHQILEQHDTEIEANKNFKYEVEVPKSRKIDISGEYITNCSKCHFSCHYPCTYGNDRDKIHCSAMSDGGTCTVCPGKCIWSVHFNQAYKFEYYEETETRTYAELEERYRDATGRKLTVEQVIEKHQEEFLSVQQCVFELITQSHKSLKRLEEIALRPNPLSTLGYVDLLIESEKREAKPGWQARLKALEDVRKEADILGKISRQADYNPFENYKKEFCGTQQHSKSKPWYKKLPTFLPFN